MKSFAEKLLSMKGKTIENITADKIGDFGARQIDLYFTDGTSESFVSSILHDGNEEWNAESEIQFLN
jgi:hypothetical protein